MPLHRWPNRPAVPRTAAKRARWTLLIILAALLLTGAVASWLAFRSLVTELAVSTAQDVVVASVNDIVKDIMSGRDFDASSLVRLEKDSYGNVTAVAANVAAVNTLSARILEECVARTAENTITVHVPVGDLLGSTLLLGKGPSVPVEVTMLSSSVAGFRSELTATGINQTRHQILLDLTVGVSLFMPWRTVSTSVDTEVLVSETVIVGRVPETYMNWEREG